MNSSAHYLEELAWRRAYALVLSWPETRNETAHPGDLGGETGKAAEAEISKNDHASR